MAFPVFLPEHPTNPRTMPPRIPRLASYRHAGPSGPWPWADMIEDIHNDDLLISNKQSLQSAADGDNINQADESPYSWRRYPTQLFPNWRGSRLLRSGMTMLIDKRDKTGPDCVVHYIDVDVRGGFSEPGQYTVGVDNPNDFWETMKVRVTWIFKNTKQTVYCLF
jgi:hypothetical protein